MSYNKILLILKFIVAIIATFHSYNSFSVIVASIKPIGFIAAAIAEGVTSVEVLLPDGISEHDYSLRPSDVKRIKNAELVVWVGPQMEFFLTKSVRNLPSDKNLIIADILEIKPLLMNINYRVEDKDKYKLKLKSDNNSYFYSYYNKYNMHLWMSPDIAKQCAIAIHSKLLKLMPQNKKVLDRNLNQFKKKLEDIDQKIFIKLSQVRNKRYFVFHDAYGYFEKHYGLSPLGYFTINPKIQISAKRLSKIKDILIEQKEAVCVFTEPQFKLSIIDSISRGIRVHLGILDPLGMGISINKNSYTQFLLNLSDQYLSCLNK